MSTVCLSYLHDCCPRFPVSGWLLSIAASYRATLAWTRAVSPYTVCLKRNTQPHSLGWQGIPLPFLLSPFWQLTNWHQTALSTQAGTNRWLSCGFTTHLKPTILPEGTVQRLQLWFFALQQIQCDMPSCQSHPFKSMRLCSCGALVPFENCK